MSETDNLRTYRDVAHALTDAVVDCPLSYHDGRPVRHRATTDADVAAWLQRLARIAETVEAIDKAETRNSISEVRSARYWKADDNPHAIASDPERLAAHRVLAILRSPEGRAAIADVIMNPPLRMADGSWRDVPPGNGPSAREAKRGDVIRHLKRGQVVAVYDNEHNGNLWVNSEGATYTVNPDEWEVVISAEPQRDTL